MRRFWREDFDVDISKNCSAAKSVPHLQFHHLATLANIVREHVKFDMFANNVAQFGHHVGQQIQVKKCSWHVCTCSEHFREHLLLDRMLSNLATMFANNSTQSGKSCARIMRKSF